MRHMLTSTLSCVTLCVRHARHLSTTRILRQTGCYDVVVSGGGMVGAAMTSALGKRRPIYYHFEAEIRDWSL